MSAWSCLIQSMTSSEFPTSSEAFPGARCPAIRRSASQRGTSCSATVRLAAMRTGDGALSESPVMVRARSSAAASTGRAAAATVSPSPVRLVPVVLRMRIGWPMAVSSRVRFADTVGWLRPSSRATAPTDPRRCSSTSCRITARVMRGSSAVTWASCPEPVIERAYAPPWKFGVSVESGALDSGSMTNTALTAVRKHGVTVVGMLIVGALILGASGLMPGVSALLIAIIAGAIARNLRVLPRHLTPSLNIVSKRLLRLGIVLLGFKLSLPSLAVIGAEGVVTLIVTVIATYVGSLAIGAALKVPRSSRMLIATGFAICGASAVAAMSSIVDPDGKREEETAQAVALVRARRAAPVLVSVPILIPAPLPVLDPVPFLLQVAMRR